MRKFTILLSLLTCIAFTAFAQNTIPLSPDAVPKFYNDLPVISQLGLRVDLTEGSPYKNYTVTMEQTTQDLLGGGLGFETTVWGYKFPGLPATYPGATIVAMRDQAVEIKWKNKLPGHFLPVDPTMHMAHPPKLKKVSEIRDWYAAGNVPTVAHLHGGHTESASDGLPEAWFTQEDEVGKYFVKQKYRYDNDQQAATLWYHDHALGITRLNVYAGLAGFYLLRDENELGLIDDGVLPSGDQEIEIVIQDRMFDTQGQLFWPAYPGDPFYDDFITGEGAILPPEDFPGGGPTALAEFFGNIILVNGVAWPKLEVQPRKYRFRLLNGSDSRFYVLNLEDHPFWVIGSDNGLLDQPVQLTQLLFAPGERYDVVVDFSEMEGEDIILLNLGPDAPYGGSPTDPTAGLGPGDFFPVGADGWRSTERIMQFQVGVAEDLPEGFEDVSVDGSTVLNEDLPDFPAATVTRELVLFEGMDEYGRLQPLLGTVVDGSLTWMDAITENPDVGATEIWEVYNATGDAHPVHLHLVSFEILGRQESEVFVTEKPQLQHNGAFGTGFTVTGVDYGPVVQNVPYERGWKDTFVVPPGQVGRVRATFDRPGRYVWHCHILSHEDHEMMRPFHVGPIPPPPKGQGGKKAAVVEDQPELDFEFRLYPNPASEQITVDLMLEEGAEISVSIYGLDGKVLNSEKLGYLNDGLQSIAVPVGHLDNGMYVFELKAGDKQFRESIFISK